MTFVRKSQRKCPKSFYPLSFVPYQSVPYKRTTMWRDINDESNSSIATTLELPTRHKRGILLLFPFLVILSLSLSLSQSTMNCQNVVVVGASSPLSIGHCPSVIDSAVGTTEWRRMLLRSTLYKAPAAETTASRCCCCTTPCKNVVYPFLRSLARTHARHSIFGAALSPHHIGLKERPSFFLLLCR